MNHAVHLLLARAQVVDEKPLAGPAPDFLGHGGKQAFLALDEGGLLRPQAQVRLDAETDGAAVLLRADLDALDHDPLPVPGAALRVLLRKKENALVEVEFFLFLCPEEETADFASRLLVGPCRGQRVVDDDESPGREVLRQALEAPGALLVRVEKGEELRVEGARRPVADRLGETLFRPGGQPQLTGPDPQVAKGPASGLLREDELAGRREGEFGEFLAGALRGDVHLADGFDLVALKQQPVRPRRRGRVDIDHVSPEAEISALLDERHPAVPAFGERCGEEVPVDCVADGDGGDEAGHDAPRHDLLQQGRPGYDDNGGVVLRSGWRERGSVSSSTSFCDESASGSMRSQGGMRSTESPPAKKAVSCASVRASSAPAQSTATDRPVSSWRAAMKRAFDEPFRPVTLSSPSRSMRSSTARKAGSA